MGQSIAPRITFKISYLQKTRLQRLQAMAAIASLLHSLLPQLQHELHTTQLIFVNSRPIDISFRNDERRFDVEGLIISGTTLSRNELISAYPRCRGATGTGW